RCNICVEVCPFDAIAMLPEWEGHEQSKFDRRELVMDLDDLLAPSRARADLPFWIPETVLEQTSKERDGRKRFIAERAAAEAPAQP
ncbi:MAG: 4Fe-4S binding protein, partial [Chloroflexi bacterium]|nr:4Fe-4S binding protein [Chloroflexota bacterium]